MDDKEKKDIQKVRAPSRVPRRSTAPCSAAAAMCGGGRASVYAACRSPSTLPVACRLRCLLVAARAGVRTSSPQQSMAHCRDCAALPHCSLRPAPPGPWLTPHARLQKTNGVFEMHIKNSGGKELVYTIDLKKVSMRHRACDGRRWMLQACVEASRRASPRERDVRLRGRRRAFPASGHTTCAYPLPSFY
jgi:hypothetical protein